MSSRPWPPVDYSMTEERKIQNLTRRTELLDDRLENIVRILEALQRPKGEE